MKNFTVIVALMFAFNSPTHAGPGNFIKTTFKKISRIFGSNKVKVTSPKVNGHPVSRDPRSEAQYCHNLTNPNYLQNPNSIIHQALILNNLDNFVNHNLNTPCEAVNNVSDDKSSNSTECVPVEYDDSTNQWQESQSYDNNDYSSSSSNDSFSCSFE